MPMTIKCTACGQGYTVRDELAGKRVKCRCGASFAVPAPTPVADLLEAELVSAAAASTPQGPASGPSTAGLPSAAGSRLSPLPRKQSRDKTVLIFGIVATGVTVVLIAALVIFMFTRNGDTAASSSSADSELLASVDRSTPEAVFEAHKQAMIDKDWKMSIALVTPETQEMMVGMIASVAVNLAPKDKEIADVLKKHGIDQSMWESQSQGFTPGNFKEMMQKARQRMQRYREVIKDKPAFYVEAMGHIDKAGRELMKKSGGGSGGDFQGELAKSQAETKLIDVVITGNTAKGKQSFSFRGKTTDVPVAFKRIDGEWYVHQAGIGQESSQTGSTPP